METTTLSSPARAAKGAREGDPSAASPRGEMTFASYPTTFIPLDRLDFGHAHPGGEINIRNPAREECAALAESIRREGLLQALCVWNPEGDSIGPFYVLGGGRRLMALQTLRDAGAFPDDLPVSCVVLPDGLTAADALAKSLAIEDMHVSPHPVDRFETFSRLSARGMTADQIAARFGVEKKLVRQSLALGALAPEVRAAWRAGELDQAGAQCFTLAESPAEQTKVLTKLQKKRPPTAANAATSPASAGADVIPASEVRKQFTGSEAEANRLLRFVGRDAYVAAAGALTEDLFTSSIVIHDFAKLKRLAEEKLDAECHRLRADGWSFTETQLKRSYSNSGGSSPPAAKGKFTAEERDRLAEIANLRATLGDNDVMAATELDDEEGAIDVAARLRAYSAAEKKTLGCVVYVDLDGELAIDSGIRRTEPQPAGREHPQKKTTAPAERDVSFVVEQALNEWRSAAAGETLARDESLALAALLAELQYSRGLIPIADGQHIFVPKSDSYAKILSELRKQKPTNLVSLLIKAVGESITLASDYNDMDEDFLAALDQGELQKAMKRRFDAMVYFDGCSKPYLLQIITEVLGDDFAPADKSKHDLAELCTHSVAPLGWLPPELRTKNYLPPFTGEVSAKRTKGAAASRASTPAKRGRPPKSAPKPAAKKARAK